MSALIDTFDDYQFVTSGIQLAVNDFYDSHKYLTDEAVDQIIDNFWEDIPLDMNEISINHPGIDGSFLLIELNPDYDEESEDDEDNYPYMIHRVYSNNEDASIDDAQIENGTLQEAQMLSLVLRSSARTINACY